MANVTAKWIPLPQEIIDRELQSLPGVQAALRGIGKTVTVRMQANVRGPRVGPFRKRAFVGNDPEDPATVIAGTRWKLAHLFEFGSANTSVHGWLRSAAQGIPSTRFEPGGGPA